jgi:hypothetical protein
MLLRQQILLIANIKEILKFVLERSEATLGVTPKMGSISIPSNHLPATYINIFDMKHVSPQSKRIGEIFPPHKSCQIPVSCCYA